jgi:hypothetical protein
MRIYITIALLLACVSAYSQNVGINTTGATPDPSAILDLNTGNAGNTGLLPPWAALTAVNDVTTIPNPATGLFVYNPGTGGLTPAGFYYNAGTSTTPVWTITGSSNGWILTGNAGTNGATNFIGTTNAQSFNIKVNNQWAGRIDVTGNENTNFGYQAGNFGTTTGNNNTAIGYQALFSNTSGSNNTATGYQAMKNNTTGLQNTATGYQALISNTSGIDNTATGAQALFSNTTGNHNTATGFASLQNNISGADNTGLGDQSLFKNTTGSFNTGAGDSALFNNTTGWYNTANGRAALISNTTASANSAYGSYAMHNTTTGSMNAAFGDSAMFTNTTGKENTCIGYNSDVAANNLINATAIGYNVTVNASNTMEFGNTNVIGWGFGGAIPTTGAAASHVFIVGTTGTNGNGAYLSGGGTWTNTSDRNKKENFVNVNGEAMLAKLDKLPILQWNYKGESPSIRHIGPMAQDFYHIFAVGNDSLSISTIDPAGIALAAVKELNKKLNDANTENASLKKQIQQLQDIQKQLDADKLSRQKRLNAEEEEIAQLKQMLNTLMPTQASAKGTK